MRLLIPGFVLYPSAMLEDVEVEEAGSDPGWSRGLCSATLLLQSWNLPKFMLCLCCCYIASYMCVDGQRK